ncbi:DUF1488 domain-containing protein [Vibrio navarrensis]|uniref:DUF1488 domain-containing protein n=1 Tax=Vibrio navarrensis TaxID=29495 RepID=A0AAJ4IB27_9VIBR|nr:DUF1488 domain-containing protein [Vibrio navarrensis]MBE3653905.1 transcriptional regulator [Vibrio navarrensis]QPL53564.1 DUF1488 domain-containing protein [Vibrio navarrensis]
MNQAILFPNIQSWDEKRQVVQFAAQQSGALIQCFVEKAKLEQLTMTTIANQEQALSVFAQCRFDLEEIAEELIEEEAFDDEGHIVIG